jgi:tetratricopeptide (TPR) repeat protein
MGWLERRLGGPSAPTGRPVSRSTLPAPRRPSGGPPTSRELAMRAQTLWQMGRPEDALKLLRPAIASTPDDHVLHDVAATAYGKLDRYEQAIACARRVVELNPQAGRSHRRLADLLTKANRPREAREPALTAVRLEPDDSSALATASETLRRCGDLRQATELAQRAIQLNPDRHLPLIGRLLVSSGALAGGRGSIQSGSLGLSRQLGHLFLSCPLARAAGAPQRGQGTARTLPWSASRGQCRSTPLGAPCAVG